ncbi:MAG TPA: hypothetical protein PLA08_04130, partial [Candidatus Cloacimonadota bacterium]|nr:hypothetical protein [Candidatus Cloacimonadota bacterium]
EESFSASPEANQAKLKNRIITACRGPRRSAQWFGGVDRAVIQCPGWQSPFATETGGLFQTGNSVASAEQTSAALILSA